MRTQFVAALLFLCLFFQWIFVSSTVSSENEDDALGKNLCVGCPQNRAEDERGKSFFTARRCPSSREIRKQGKCYAKKGPGDHCEHSDQCSDVGSAQYFCIANLCQLPPECQPGHVAVGAECFPFAVTGGECVHPVQCLSGSVCLQGRCRGPCDDNQVFVEDTCVDYEGGGCVARRCIEHKCPRAFPSCNYVPQKNEYLCCERQIRSAAQCPDSSSFPQLNALTNEVLDCMVEQCGPGFTCQFSSHGRSSYICCSVPTRKNRRRKVAQQQQLHRRNERTLLSAI